MGRRDEAQGIALFEVKSMANTMKRKAGRPKKVVEMPSDTPPETTQAAPEPAANAPEPPEPSEPAPRPPKSLDPKTFFGQVARIPKQDWGQGGRACIYLYALEPVVNLKVNGEDKYLCKIYEPIYDYDGIMKEYGSGKYRMHLTFRKPSAEKASEVDRHTFEIFNPQYPPKIPRKAWENDPRNQRWLALLPPEPTPASALTANMTEAFKTVLDIQREAREQMPKPTETPTAPPVTSEPLKEGLQVAQMLLGMRAENPMVSILEKMLEAQREETKELRGRLDAIVNRPQPAPPDPIAQIKTVADMFGQLKPIFSPEATAAAEVPLVRNARTPWWESLLAPIMEGLKPAVPMIVARIMNPAPPPGAAPQAPHMPAAAPPPSAQPMNGTAPPANAEQPGGLVQQIMPQLIRFFMYDEPGEEAGSEFAAWMAEGFAPDLIQQLQSPGADMIFTYFQTLPQWSNFQHDPARLRQFLEGFCTWKPEDVEEQSPALDDPFDQEEAEQHAAQ